MTSVVISLAKLSEDKLFSECYDRGVVFARVDGKDNAFGLFCEEDVSLIGTINACLYAIASPLSVEGLSSEHVNYLTI